MRRLNKLAFGPLTVIAVCVFLGCSEDGTGPGQNIPIPAVLEHHWSERFGDAESQNGLCAAVDAAGNAVIAGYFRGSVDFDGGMLTSAGQNDIFIAKFDPDGTPIWSKRFGDAMQQVAYDVAVDASGGVILVGKIWGSADFGGGVLTSSGREDIFIAKFSTGGTHIWSDRYGDGSSQEARAVATDASGNVIVTGTIRGSADFGGGVLTSADSADVFVAKFSPDGTHIWSKRYGQDLIQDSRNIAIDALGNIVIVGEFSGSVDFGGGALTSAGAGDIFVAKFSPDGIHQWSDGFGDSDTQYARGIAVDADGNVIIAGFFARTVDFGGGELTSEGPMDIYLAKFNRNGVHIWSKRFGGLLHHYAHGVAVDATGNVIMTGDFDIKVDFGGGVLESAGDLDIYVAKFNQYGRHLWSERFGGSDNQYALDVAVAATGDAVVTGFFRGSVDFGGGTLTSAGHLDVFVARFGY